MPETGVEIAKLAGWYVSYLLDPATEISGPADLSQSERAYVLWDWEGLAPLAYEQYLKRGRGAFVGPRMLADEQTVTIVFDYISEELLGGTVGPELAMAVAPYLDHYNPELDFIVTWLRKDGTARYEVLRTEDRPGLAAPRDLFERRSFDRRALLPC